MLRKMRNTGLLTALLVMIAALLGGCMYPEEKKLENQIPSEFYLEATQKAVEQFQKDTGVLPIATKDINTPIFEKYEIDFRKLMPKYLPDVPANAFEKGGIYMYTLIDVETKPTVRLIHLGSVGKVADIQAAVIRYQRNYEKLPIKADIGNGYYSIDFSKLSMKEVQVPGTAGNYLLPLVMNEKGEVGIDYAADIATVLRNSKAEVPKATDPRYVMARKSMFVPAKSFPYEMVNGEPKLLKLNN
ncbi:hypothetical protein EDM54_14710 [Brevibacillus borstelensis]|uniref:hypothetical protein n=1 Tax=Brevibacillus borstelensis TaxID=45462 RepID=UPI000F08D45C|nr:hypothetical protein [Brevibacillus borstelensis]MED1882583.1 hypothetical protein [Brevibacillus borstelensis]RNB62265.1 hypothetical protein EDM54_14710 [Brevibacillus borstelensis]GED51688.1 hypothetical protein BBO01nite_09290 [Brevibacillus borstelensis]